MSSYDEEPSPPRDDPHAYGYAHPRAYVDREVCDQQTQYAAKEPQRWQDTLNARFKMFGLLPPERG